MYLVRSLLILILTFYSLSTFSQDVIPFSEGGKWGLKESSGDVIVTPSYDYIGWTASGQEFAGELIGFQKNGFWGLLNSKGKQVVDPLYRSIDYKGGSFYIASSLGKLSKQTLYGLLDKKGKVISSFRYQNITYGYDGQYIVREQIEGRTQSGIIVPDESVILEISYQKIEVINQDQYLIKSFNGLNGVFNKSGKIIIPISYDQIQLTENDEFLLNQNELIGLSDRNGSTLHEVTAKFISNNRLESYPVWSVRDKNNETEESILADSIKPVSKNRYLIYRNNRQIIYNTTTDLSGNFEGLVILEILDDAVIAKSEEGIKVLKLTGKELLKGNYDSVYYDSKYFYTKSYSQGKKWELYSRIGSKLSKVRFDVLLPESGNRIRYKRDGFWGILNFDGTSLVQPKYDTILPFYQKRAIVKQLGLWGLIDTQNQWIILPYEESLESIRTNLFVSKKGYHIKFFDFDGRPVRSITTSYQILDDYVLISGELGKTGLMNHNGRMITSIAYDSMVKIDGADFFEVKIDSAKGIIDSGERTIIPLSDRLGVVKGVSEEKLGVQLDGKYGFVSLTGQLEIANRYDDIALFSDGLAAYKLNGKWGFLNEREELVIQPIYVEVLPFFNGVAAVRDQDRWGLINKNGKVLEDFRYSKIERTKDGKYLVTGAKGIGLIDQDGESILQPSYQLVEDLGNKRAIIKKNNNWGVINYDGTYIIPTLHKKVIYDHSQQKFLVREN